MNMTTIALLTDFGCRDSYVAAMKAVILSAVPSVNLLDLTHEIAQGDIQHGAFELWRVRPYLPKGTIIVGVVDPGVGTERRAVALNTRDIYCIGPDNGLFSYLLGQDPPQEAVKINKTAGPSQAISHTFHGRDIFAPAAALIATGTPLKAMGKPVENLTRLPQPDLNYNSPGTIQGEIIHIDHFGNLITSIGQLERSDKVIRCVPWLDDKSPIELPAEEVRIQVDTTSSLPLVQTFGDVQPGEPLAYIGSSGLLEIAVRDGSANQHFGSRRGDKITLQIMEKG